ncbi:hypothetical protein V6N13_106980 [Hibiscus sabdariffa]
MDTNMVGSATPRSTSGYETWLRSSYKLADEEAEKVMAQGNLDIPSMVDHDPDVVDLHLDQVTAEGEDGAALGNVVQPTNL